MAEKAALQSRQLGQEPRAAPAQAEVQGSAADIEEEVRRRAYVLWEQYVCLEAGEEELWLKAEREIKQKRGLDLTTPRRQS